MTDPVLAKLAPMWTPQVAGVVRRLAAAGFDLAVFESSAWVATRSAERGLVRVMRTANPPSLWATFAGWPERKITLAELRAWLDTFGASGL